MSEQMQQEQEFDLRVYVEMILRRKWIIVGFTAVLSTLVAIGTALQPKVYEAKASVVGGREAPRLVDFDPIPQDRFRERDYLKTQAAILTSRSLLQRAARHLIDEGFYGPVKPQDVERRSMDFAKSIQLREKVVTTEDSQVIQIVMEGGVPDRVARIANAIADEYVTSNLEQKQQMATQAVAWLEKKLAEAEKALKQSQAELQAFKDKEKITASDEADPFSTLSFTRLNDEYLTTHIQRMQLESRMEAIRKARAQAPVPGAPSATQSLDAEIQKQMKASLQKEYVDGQLQLKDLSQRYGEQHPDIIALKAKLAKLQKELQALDEPEPAAVAESAPALPTGNLADLKAEYDALVSKEKLLSRTLEAQKAETRNLSRTGATYTLLKQNVDFNDKIYNDLLSRLNAARMSGEIKVSGVQILDRAEAPRAPSEPQPVRNMIVAVLLGLVLGVGLVLLMENLDRRVKSPQDAARHLKLPLLTVVPGMGLSQGVGREEGKAQLVTVQQPRSHASECYRNLRTSILFSSGRPVPRTILVTSAVAGEGKSTTAANLAVVMAQSGRKTLLIDADLRRPALHRYFSREGNRGIVRLLQEGCRVEDAIQSSGIENLDLLLCHGIPKNPSELLGSERMQDLIERLKGKYEVVVIDSPVVISVPDAVILAARAEAVILVHRPGAADRDMVRHAREKLEEVKANILGLVMNNVNLKSGGYQYAEYLYYGYGTEGERKARREKSKERKA